MTAPSPELLAAFREAVRAKIRDDLEREAEYAARAREEVLPFVRRAVAEARSRGECGRAWLFGSFAWGRPTERSDVDVLVEGAGGGQAIAAEIEEGTGRMVHLVEYESAPAELRARAEADGVPVSPTRA